jgi:hypothetical protein
MTRMMMMMMMMMMMVARDSNFWLILGRFAKSCWYEFHVAFYAFCLVSHHHVRRAADLTP